MPYDYHVPLAELGRGCFFNAYASSPACASAPQTWIDNHSEPLEELLYAMVFIFSQHRADAAAATLRSLRQALRDGTSSDREVPASESFRSLLVTPSATAMARIASKADTEYITFLAGGGELPVAESACCTWTEEELNTVEELFCATLFVLSQQRSHEILLSFLDAVAQAQRTPLVRDANGREGAHLRAVVHNAGNIAETAQGVFAIYQSSGIDLWPPCPEPIAMSIP